MLPNSIKKPQLIGEEGIKRVVFQDSCSYLGPVSPTNYLETLRTTSPEETSHTPHSSVILPTSSFAAVTSSGNFLFGS